MSSRNGIARGPTPRKRRDSRYEPGRRSGAWVKMRVNRRKDFIVGGYLPRGTKFDSVLVSYFDARDLRYAGSVRGGFTPSSREALFAAFPKLECPDCPFVNLPDESKDRWGTGITFEKMAGCRWVKPRIVVTIDFLEWTLDDRLRHAFFVEQRKDQPAKSVVRE